jgi:hypothetical protein
MTSHEITRLNEMLEDSDRAEEIGSNLLKKAMHAAAAERAGVTLDDPSVERTVEVGDHVPVGLRNKVNLNEDGTAADGWSDNWTDLGVWQKDWAQSTSGMDIAPEFGGAMGVTDMTPLRRDQVTSMFSDDEIDVLQDQGLLEDL